MQWPPDPGARPERHEPEGLGGRGVDDLPDVEAHPLAEQRQLVDQRDVDVAEDVLEELGELGGVRRGELQDRVVDAPQEGRGARRARRGQRRRRGAGRRAGALAGSPGLTRSGAKARSKSRPATRPDRSRAPRGSGPVGRAREGRRLEDDELARAEVLADESRPPTAPARGRGPWPGDRGRDADEDRRRASPSVASVELLTIRSRPSAARRRAARRRCRRSASGRPRSSSTRRCSASTPTTSDARLDEGEGERQADVAEADDRDALVAHVASTGSSDRIRWPGSGPRRSGRSPGRSVPAARSGAPRAHRARGARSGRGSGRPRRSQRQLADP